MTREEAKKIIGELLLFGKAPCKKEELEDLCKIVLTALEQEPTEQIHSKTCGACRHFRKNRNERNIEICKELYGENTMCGYCTYWEDYCEVALPTTEYDYCSHHREI